MAERAFIAIAGDLTGIDIAYFRSCHHTVSIWGGGAGVEAR